MGTTLLQALKIVVEAVTAAVLVHFFKASNDDTNKRNNQQ